MKTTKRYRVVSELHDDAPKRITTQRATALETARSRVFTRSRSTERITTTTPSRGIRHPQVTRVNSTNVLDEGLRIGEIWRWMNSKVKLVETGVYRK
jgi:hypothetical protein